MLCPWWVGQRYDAIQTESLLHMFEVLEFACLELGAYSVECLNYSHYFVPEGKQRNENGVWWRHRCNSQHSTAENSQSAFFSPVWVTEVFVCFGQQCQHWHKWFHFRSQEYVDLLCAKINTFKEINTALFFSWNVIQPLVSEGACSGLLSELKQRNWWSSRADQQTRWTGMCCSLQTPGSRQGPARSPENGGEILRFHIASRVV